MATRAEYNLERARKKRVRLSALEDDRRAREVQRQNEDRAMVREVLALIDNGTRPIHDAELREMGHCYLRVMKAEVARKGSPIVCSDGAYYRFDARALA